MNPPDLFRQSIDESRRVSKRMHPSRKWTPLKQTGTYADDQKLKYRGKSNGQVEGWTNDLYEITVRRYSDGWAFDETMPWVYIGIAAVDGAARHDWRDMQKIKNQICGPEWEAVEVFPAESRLIDPSNYYLLFCAPKIPIGRFTSRQIADPSNSLAPQRGWAPGEQPRDSGKFLERRESLDERLARLL